MKLIILVFSLKEVITAVIWFVFVGQIITVIAFDFNGEGFSGKINAREIYWRRYS